MSKASRILLVAFLVLTLSLIASVAMAASPDDATTATTVIDPVTGASRWTYQDAYDGAAKTEGAYKAFDDQGNALYTTNPHGGYDSTTNKCKVCHAVHRAEGAYFLLRADTQDDACSYCHIGGSAHSRKVVYDLAGTIYTPNGHTIGASSIIPDSSVKQWLEETTLTTVDADGNPITEVVEVRRYYERRNKMFRFAKHHGQSAAANAPYSKYSRIGLLALRCMNCHQPHNAIELVWTPPVFPTTPGAFDPANTASYKLLRASPSGSVAGDTLSPHGAVNSGGGWGSGTESADDLMINREGVHAHAWDGIAPDEVVKVPETTITTANTGYPYTIWTRWPGDEYAEDPAHNVDRSPSHVNQLTLSVWCADCHNLNIGYWEETAEEFGEKIHGERTHPAPYTGAYNGPAQCYSCHRNDMPLMSGTRDEYGLTYTAKYLYDSSRAECEQCHFGTASYYDVKMFAAFNDVSMRYDFPHSGGSGNMYYPSYIKMLGPWTSETTEGGYYVSTVTVTENNLDAVCKRCHPGIGRRH